MAIKHNRMAVRRYFPGKAFELFNGMKALMNFLIMGLITNTLVTAAEARIDRRKAKPIPTALLRMQNPMEPIKKEDIEEIVPLDLKPTNNAAEVATRIGDKAFQKFSQSSEMKNSSFGRAASTVQNSMKAEVNVGSASPEATQHKLSFQVMALQSTGQVQYKGWTNATVKVDTRHGQTQVEISEKLFHDKNFYMNHTMASQEETSSVGLRWNW